MLLGLVTDIHNEAANLAVALALFHRRGVERVVTLGDSLDPFSSQRGEEDVAGLLEQVGAVGVWGNHDMCLCHDVTHRAKERFPSVLPYMATLRPWLALADCRFSHEEADIDPYDALAMWLVSDGGLDLAGKAGRAFAAAAERVQFVGHYHRWWAGTPAGPTGWTGAGPLRLESASRYFVVVAPVFDGWCAVYDTATGLLEPLRCSAAA